MTTFVCGIDVGGTFTDCVVLDDEGRVTTAKAPTDYERFDRGVVEALRIAAADRGLELGDVLSNASTVRHGTTIGTNAMIQRRGSRVGLITTRGAGDVLPTMRGNGRTAGLPIEQLVHMQATSKPSPLVPKRLIKEIDERCDWKGAQVVALDEDGVRAAVKELLEEGVEAIAISFLWSIANDEHERRARAIAAELAPDLFVTTGSELASRVGEYERTVAAAINAYIGPTTAGYMRNLEGTLRAEGFSGDLMITTCSGGVIPVAAAIEAPLLTIGSGPAAGVVGSSRIGDLLGSVNVIATDMGGTSFDVGLIWDSKPATVASMILDQYEFNVPNIHVRSVGAGGGSIASVDPQTKSLRVGPESAGSQPGPVCYGRGGTQPTVTDADVVIGFVDPDYFLGGRTRLDRDAAERAIREHIGEPLGLSVYEAAAGIQRIVDFRMADLIRKSTVEQGYDPSDFVLFAYGGAGGVHAGGYARELGVKHAVLPIRNMSSVWSAFGAASSDVTYVSERPLRLRAPFDPRAVNETVESLDGAMRAQLRDSGMSEDRIEIELYAQIKYAAQIHEVEVPLPAGTQTDATLSALVDRFEAKYEALYGEGSGYSAHGYELIGIRCVGIGVVPAVELADARGLNGHAARPPRSRQVYFAEAGGMVETPVYSEERLNESAAIEGPAVIELPSTSLVIHPGQSAEADGYGNIALTL